MKTALIIGAGPAGLTAALELLRTTDIKPVIVESEDFVGGISRTAVHNGNRMDIGGHGLAGGHHPAFARALVPGVDEILNAVFKKE